MNVYSSVLQGREWATLRSVAAAASHTLARGNTPNILPRDFGEPDIAIRPGGDARGSALGRGDTERGKEARGGDPPDHAPIEFRKPQVAI
jgi:hypothetical protein